MPPLAAIGASIATAAAAVTLEGLAIGASIVGTGMKVVGMATGSKTLQKIGDGFSMAGGAGLAGSMLRGGMSSASVTGGLSKSGGLLKIDNMDKILSSPTKGTSGFKTFSGGGAESSSMDAFNKASGGVGANGFGSAAGSFDPELERTFFQRANTTLTQYNPMMNMLGGMGDAYMMNERMNLEKKLLDKRLGFEQQMVDRVNTNNGTPLNINPALNLGRNTGAYTGMLRG